MNLDASIPSLHFDFQNLDSFITYFSAKINNIRSKNAQSLDPIKIST